MFKIPKELKFPKERAPRKNFQSKTITLQKISSNPNRIAVGVASIETIFWNVEEDNNLVIAGSAGSGKTVLLRSIYSHCLAYPEEWDIYGVDLRKSELVVNSKFRNVKEVSLDLEETLEMLLIVYYELNRRKEILEEYREKGSSKDLPKFKKILLAIDELEYFLTIYFFGGLGAPGEHIAKMIPQVITEILNNKEELGIHVVASTQRISFDNKFFRYKPHMFSFKVATKLNPIAEPLFFGHKLDSYTLEMLSTGVSYFEKSNSAKGVMRMFFSEPNWIQQKLSKKNLNWTPGDNIDIKKLLR